jgi:hypothetical protein
MELFETDMDQIRNWLTGFDFWHGLFNLTPIFRLHFNLHSSSRGLLSLLSYV